MIYVYNLANMYMYIPPFMKHITASTKLGVYTVGDLGFGKQGKAVFCIGEMFENHTHFYGQPLLRSTTPTFDWKQTARGPSTTYSC